MINILIERSVATPGMQKSKEERTNEDNKAALIGRESNVTPLVRGSNIIRRCLESIRQNLSISSLKVNLSASQTSADILFVQHLYSLMMRQHAVPDQVRFGVCPTFNGIKQKSRYVNRIDLLPQYPDNISNRVYN